MEKIIKNCVLDENKECNDCRQCDYCDLEPTKICNNCSKCLDMADYNGTVIEKVDMSTF